MAIGMPGRGGDKGEPPQTFGSLTIGRRVLLTPSRTISIPNIATVTVGTRVEGKSPYPLFGAIASAAGAIVALNPDRFGAINTPLLAGSAIALLIFLYYLLKAADKSHYLIITTSDGTATHFTGPQRETLHNVRRILSDKINAHDETATFNINFENGTIESLNVGEIGKLETAAVINGSNNQVVTNSPEARIRTKDTIFTANHSPGAQLGQGNVANGSANTVQITHIDYATVLPQIEQMQRFYAQNPHARPVEERLAELELLMRSSTPTTEGRSRVRDLAVDLSTLLQGYPAMVQFFQNIVHLAGL